MEALASLMNWARVEVIACSTDVVCSRSNVAEDMFLFVWSANTMTMTLLSGKYTASTYSVCGLLYTVL